MRTWTNPCDCQPVGGFSSDLIAKMDCSANSELESQHHSDDAIHPFKKIARRLYLSHALSTWNSRMFEFGAVLFLAEIFPGTLFYASFYALIRALFAAMLSSWVGGQMDKSHRLKAIRQSISELYSMQNIEALLMDYFWG